MSTNLVYIQLISINLTIYFYFLSKTTPQYFRNLPNTPPTWQSTKHSTTVELLFNKKQLLYDDTILNFLKEASLTNNARTNRLEALSFPFWIHHLPTLPVTTYASNIKQDFYPSKQPLGSFIFGFTIKEVRTSNQRREISFQQAC